MQATSELVIETHPSIHQSMHSLDIAGEWFEASGLPEGLFARGMHARSKVALQYQDDAARAFEVSPSVRQSVHSRAF